MDHWQRLHRAQQLRAGTTGERRAKFDAAIDRMNSYYAAKFSLPQDCFLLVEPMPVKPDLNVYEVLQPKVIIPVTVITEPNAALLEAENKQLRYNLNDARQQVQDRLAEVFELQKRLMAYSMATMAPAEVEEDTILTDEVTVKTVTHGRGGSLVFAGYFTEHIQSGEADETSKVGNIGAWWEHKICLTLAGYKTLRLETMVGARILTNKDVNRRIKAVRSATSGEWFSHCNTNELKAGDVVVDRTTHIRRTIKKVAKDIVPSYGESRGEDHYRIVFDTGEPELVTRSARWFLVWSPDVAAERLAA